MSDIDMRLLERLAATGDVYAKIKLDIEKKRAGVYSPLPINLYVARARRPAKHTRDFFTRPNRNRQRFRRHIMGVCNNSCRFCRRHGPYK